MVDLLLDHGADPNVELSNAYEYQTYSISPLMLAVWREHEELVKLLLERGANANSEHRFGKIDNGVPEYSALGLAMKQRNTKIFEILRAGGASGFCVCSNADPDQRMYSAEEYAKEVGTSQEIRDILEGRQGGKLDDTTLEPSDEVDAEPSQSVPPTKNTAPPPEEPPAVINEQPSTETDWLKCNERGPGYAIEQLRHDRSNHRKLFLAGCAWARRFWEKYRLGRRSKTAIEIYERFADGEAPAGDYQAAWSRFKQMFEKEGDYFAWMGDVKESESDFFTALIQARAAWQRALPYMKDDPAAEAVIVLPARGVYSLGRGAYMDASDEFAFASGNQSAEYQAQCDILGDVFGNPSRPVLLEPSWLSANEGAAVKIAQAIYDERTFDCMPEFADVLEKCGCHNQRILAHCRFQRGHVRGCWVIDLLLAKDQIEFPFGARMPLLLQVDIDEAPSRF